MASIMVKNIPNDLYERLKVAASAHHRSISSEVVNCLKIALKTRAVPVEERLTRIRSLRSKVDSEGLDADGIAAAIHGGR